MKKFVVGLGCALFLVGCGAETPTPEIEIPVEVPEDSGFSLNVIEQPPAPERDTTFAEAVVEVEPEPEFEIVKSFEDFSSASYDDLNNVSPFVLFFTKEDCERCDQMDQFFSRNLSTFPNHAQILRVMWDEFPNLQTDLNVRRPATMVFFQADGTTETLFAPPPDRVIQFFLDTQPTS